MKYDTGTVAVTSGSAAVVGTGTKWSTEAAVGQMFTRVGSGVSYQISAIADDTHLTLAAVYGGATESGAPYTIVQSFTSNYDIPYPDIGDVQTATILKRALQLIDQLLSPATATTVQLESQVSTINTSYKKLGKCVWNSTTGKPVYASGTAAASVWKDATGTNTHTPV